MSVCLKENVLHFHKENFNVQQITNDKKFVMKRHTNSKNTRKL